MQARTGNGWRRSVRWLAGTIGVLLVAVSVYGTDPVRTTDGSKAGEGRSASRGTERRSTFHGIAELAAEQGIPVAPAVQAHPSRRIEPLLEREQIEIDTARNLRSLGGTPITARTTEGSVAGPIPQPGDPCITELGCEDCAECTFDRCRPGKCSPASSNAGFPCSVDSQCTPDGVGTCEFFKTCNGGSQDGLDCSSPAGAAACTGGGGTCAPRDGACSGGSSNPGAPCRVGSHCPGGICEYRTCQGGTEDLEDCSTGPLATACTSGGGLCVTNVSNRELRCVRVQEPAGAAGECSDGFTCNGQEQCSAGGLCETVAACPTGEVCDPNRNAGTTAIGSCRPRCTATSCNDSLSCNGVEACNVGTGLCSPPAAVCGQGAPCFPGVPATTFTCGNGRCCDNTNVEDCTRTTVAACTGSRNWLGVGDRQSTSEDDNTCDQLAGANDELFEGEDFQCPRYASGLSPLGPLTVQVGRIEAANCEPLQEVGDDYEIEQAVSGSYFELTTMRFIGGYKPGVGFDRMRITFYDSTGNFIEDSITDSQSSVTGVVVRTFIWSEKPVIPSQGYVTIKPARKFSDDTHAYWMATDAVDHGSNAAVGMYYRRAGDSHAAAQVTVDVLGRCNGGTRNGLYCDRRNVNADCPPAGICDNVPDILAFELVGNEVDAPVGACCITATGSCELEVPWVCEGQGDVFQGIGTQCRACSGDNFTSCTVDNDCLTCHGGTQNNQPCNTPALVTACENGLGTCPEGTCLPFLPACTTIACCETATGNCLEVEGRCVGDNSPCQQNSDCTGPGEGGTCNQVCPVGSVGQGYGSECLPNNCCEQPVYTGADNCDEVTVHVFNVDPDPNVTETRTISGDNSTATFNAADCGLLGGPLGGINDQNWWESFTIDRCANVRMDFCCADPLHEPQWFTLLQGCPCERFVAGDAVPAPIGDLNTDGSERGLPFCTRDDNLWSTYGPLLPGQYFFPVLSALDGVFGKYQLHMTVSACTPAACCIPNPVCQKLSELSLQVDPSGSVINCPNGNSDCDTANGYTCQSDCMHANEPDCGSANGFWMHFRNLPVGEAPVVDCASNRCNIGACCTGLDCEDRSSAPTACDQGNPVTCMSRSICTATQGRFVGGALCSDDYPRDACPACEFESAARCQALDGGEDYELGTLSDLAVGQMAADDFIPRGGAISRLCLIGQYVSEDKGATTVKCAPEGTENGVVDKFLVRVYANDPVTNLPGALIGERTATVQLKALDSFTSYLEWHKLQLLLSSPIGGLTVGQCHWLEVTNNTNETTIPDTANRCRFYWGTHIPDTLSHQGNRYSAIAPARPAPFVGPSPYVLGNHRALDMLFCLDVPFDANGCGDRPGACCECDASVCLNSTRLRTCNAQTRTWHGEDPDCADVTCSTAAPLGDTCDTDFNGTPDGAIVATDGLYVAHTQCANTDGPAEIRGSPFDNDIWYSYTATCTGKLTLSMCGSALSFDSFIAAYANRPPGNKKVCTCPGTSNANLWPVGPGGEAGSDEECHRGFIGPGFLVGRVEKGDCVLVRLGGYGAASGDSSLTITCEPATCYIPPWDPPRIVQHDSNPSGPTLLADMKMNRYLGIKPPNDNHQLAISVLFKTLPAPFNIWNNRQLWVQNPVQRCETGGSDSTTTCAHPFFQQATLGCAPFFRDWTTLPGGVVYVTHPGLVPSRYNGAVLAEAAEYEIRMFDEGCTIPAYPDEYSDAATVVQTKYGDMAGPYDPSGPYYTTAEGANVGVGTDVTAILNKFGNRPGAPNKARADMEPCKLDHKINIGDVNEALNGFRNLAYRFAPGTGSCPSVDPCAYGAALEVAAGE